MWYTVQRRMSEILVRLALVSTRSAILWLRLKETLLVISAGLHWPCSSILGTHLAIGFLFWQLGRGDIDRLAPFLAILKTM